VNSPRPTIAGKIRLGPAGWSYSDWNGVVYPRRRGRNFHPLKYLARFFNALEINTTFYHIPPPAHSEEWVKVLERIEDFLLTVKVWQGFTHVRAALETRALNRWHAAIEPLRRSKRLGAVLLQFPWSFRRNRRNFAYLEALAMALAPDPLAIEMRHDSWNCDEFLAWLREKGYAFCNIDQPRLERCLTPTDYVTAPIGYVRLHGRNSEKWFNEGAENPERYEYLYRPEPELVEWAERVRRMVEKTRLVFVITNNHPGGRAVANALQIKAILSGEKVEAPPTLLRRYPEELRPYVCLTPRGGRSEEPDAEQLSLF